MAETDYLSGARELALAAGHRVMDLLKGPLVKTRKADHSIVTNADHAANDILRQGLRRLFPSHAVLSEETGLEGPSGASHLWLVDPLDGTRAYARGEAGFSVMLGLLEEGEPVFGLVYDPWEDRLYDAARGGGAYLTEKGKRGPLWVSKRAAWPEMPVVISSGFPAPLKADIERRLGVSFLAPINSVGIKVGYLARQEADIYLNHHPVHYWDTLGPLVVLEEAGGRMTNWDGTPLSYAMDGRFAHGQATAASNGPHHEALIRALPALK